MTPTRKTGRASINAGVTSTNLVQALEVEEGRSIASWWHDRDLLLMPFTAYWILVTQYQIACKMSDFGLAKDLGVNRRTILAWRSAIQSEWAISHLLITNNINKERKYSVNEIKLDDALQERLNKIDRSRIPSGRSNAGLPQNIFPLGGFSFDENSALLNPIKHAIRASNVLNVTTAAIAQRLNTAAKKGQPGDPYDSEAVLNKQLALAGEAAAKMLSLRALSIFGNSSAPDNLDENRRELYSELEIKLNTAAAHIRKRSKIYFFELVAHADMNEGWRDLIDLTQPLVKRPLHNPMDLASLDSAARNFVETGIERFEELLRRLEDLSQGKTTLKK